MNYKNFIKILQKKSNVYAFFIYNIILKNNIILIKFVELKNKNRQKIQNIISIFELKKYVNVFLIEKTNKLFLNEEFNHVIKTIAKSFYKSLYNLFNTKFTTLKQYLNNFL